MNESEEAVNMYKAPSFPTSLKTHKPTQKDKKAVLLSLLSAKDCDPTCVPTTTKLEVKQPTSDLIARARLNIEHLVDLSAHVH